MDLSFWKMHGAGNSYVFFYNVKSRIKEQEKFVKTVSDKNRGIGSDGVIFLEPSSIADIRMIMYNADGSRGLMCGNGIRCTSFYLWANHMAELHQQIETDVGIRKGLVLEANSYNAFVEANMGFPVFAKQVSLCVNKTQWNGYYISMGNPHFIVLTDMIDTIVLEQIGKEISEHPYFENGCNISFIMPIDHKAFRMRVWERGSGETKACGSGACASVVALTLMGIVPKGRWIQALMPGGACDVCYESDGIVYLRGMVHTIMTGVLHWEEG